MLAIANDRTYSLITSIDITAQCKVTQTQTQQHHQMHFNLRMQSTETLSPSSYLKKSSQPSLMIDGSNCNERKLSFKTFTGLRVFTSSKIKVLSRKLCLFPPDTGLLYAAEEEMGDWSISANHRDEPNTRQRNCLGIFCPRAPRGDPAEISL